MKNQGGLELQMPYLLIVLAITSVSSSVPSECWNYQVLSHESRSIDYYFSNSVKCDNGLAAGWYRLMGKAGSQLPEQPIVNSNSPYRCNTAAIAWITQPHPRFGEGKVARTVCFHWWSNNCQWSVPQTIVINCGNYFVYYLKPTPGCSMRYCGDTTNHTKVQETEVKCYANFMEIQLSRNSFNASKYKSITLKDKNCPSSMSLNRITLGSKLDSCGTTRRETTSQIIYTNEAILVANQDSSIITRDHDQVISFSCTYNKDGYTNQTSFAAVRRITGNESSFGSFTFELEMHRDQSFGVPYTSYPVSVNLNDRLYFQVKASVEDNGLVLLIDKCYSTPIMNRNDYRKYTLIEKGCPTDNTVQFHSADRQRQRFSIRAFRYVSNHTTVYIHCLVLLCQKSSSDSRCVSGCSGNNVHRAKREISDTSSMKNGKKSYSEYYTLDLGPVNLADKQKSTDNAASKAPMTATTIGLVVGVAVLALFVVALIIKVKYKKKAVEHSSKSYGVDNLASVGDVAVIGK